jgi:tRNA (guanine-N7-)-methyltransferase
MPHIKFKNFSIERLEPKEYNNTKVLFIAKDRELKSNLVGVDLKGNQFLLELKRDKKDNWLLKYDKVTRPLDANLVKEAIGDIAEGLGLDVFYSNIVLSKVPIANEFEKSIEEFEDIEFPFENVSVEIGFGSGKHILYQAEKNPSELFIGIEIHTPSAQQLLRQIELKGLKNIWVVNYDARLLLEMIESNRISRIFVHFPVPWDKKPHRRVISPSFLKEAMRVLKPMGKLELRTDSPNYFWYSLDVFLGDGVERSEVLVLKNRDLGVISKYEARWRRQKKDIYDVLVTSKEKSKEREINIDFSFKRLKFKSELLNNIPKGSLVFDSFFINFKKIYIVNKSSILLKLSFGSFDKPEQKYILIDRDRSYYFGMEPVKTYTNYRAHLAVEERLCQI